MISKIIEDYYEKLCDEWKLKNKTLPKVPYNQKVSSDFYIGNKDIEGYIEWKIIKVKNIIAPESLDNEVGIKLHKNIYEYFNSYYFLDISGFIDDNEIALHNLTPDTNYLIFLRRRFENLIINKERVKYIQIGDYNTSEDSFFLCVDNDTGEIVYFDPEIVSVKIISESLEKLVLKMIPRY
ncbi:MAG: SecY-interacting protein Syd [Eubacteriales bacterium]